MLQYECKKCFKLSSKAYLNRGEYWCEECNEEQRVTKAVENTRLPYNYPKRF